MTVVVDANLLVALTTNHPLRAQSYDQFQLWFAQGVPLHAPDLTQYEVMSALPQLIGAGQSSQANLAAICVEVANLPIIYHAMQLNLELLKSLCP